MAAVTIEDIARVVGCAPGTVSRALNGRKGVREETRQRIMEVAEQMGYEPNAIAQSLVSRQTHVIALVVPDITEPILSSIALAADAFLFERGYTMLLCNSGYDVEQENKKLAFVSRRKVDGLLVRPCRDDVDNILSLGLPTVLVSHTYNGPLSYIDVENETAGYLGTRHLLDCGYKRIAFLGGPPLSHVTLRYQGYCRALAERGLTPDPACCLGGEYTTEGGYRAMCAFAALENPPDAVFSCNDRTALGVLRRVHELGLRVPDDFGIMGFNDDETAAWPEFNLTTIRQPVDYMGGLAAKILLEQIEQGSNAMPQKIQIYPQIIPRGTTRPLRGQ